MLNVAEVRARGVALPSDDAAAQDVIDEIEAWLASRIGPLDGERTETFHDPASSATLRLRRPTDTIDVTDDGSAVTDVELRGQVVLRTSGYWGSEVTVTYTPTDEALVRGVLIELLRLGQTDTGYESETIGSYSYSRPRGDGVAARWSLLRRLLPRPMFDSIPIRSAFERPWLPRSASSDTVSST